MNKEEMFSQLEFIAPPASYSYESVKTDLPFVTLKKLKCGTGDLPKIWILEYGDARALSVPVACWQSRTEFSDADSVLAIITERGLLRDYVNRVYMFAHKSGVNIGKHDVRSHMLLALGLDPALAPTG